jgi:hypothetical protein
MVRLFCNALERGATLFGRHEFACHVVALLPQAIFALKL